MEFIEKKLTNTIQELKNQIQELENQIQGLKIIEKQKKLELDTLKQTNVTLNQEIINLQTELTAQKNQNQDKPKELQASLNNGILIGVAGTLGVGGLLALLLYLIKSGNLSYA